MQRKSMQLPEFIHWLEQQPDHTSLALNTDTLNYAEIAELIRGCRKMDAGRLEDLAAHLPMDNGVVMTALPALPADVFYFEIDVPSPNHLYSGDYDRLFVLCVKREDGLEARYWGRNRSGFVDPGVSARIIEEEQRLNIGGDAKQPTIDPGWMASSAESLGLTVLTFLEVLALPFTRTREVSADPHVNRARLACGLLPALPYVQVLYEQTVPLATYAMLRRSALDLAARHWLQPPAAIG